MVNGGFTVLAEKGDLQILQGKLLSSSFFNLLLFLCSNKHEQFYTERFVKWKN